jgi:hypothetical protein
MWVTLSTLVNNKAFPCIAKNPRSKEPLQFAIYYISQNNEKKEV